jgi:hypothetical protein
MTARQLLLASCVAFMGSVAMVPTPASSTVTAFEGYDENDPIGSTSKELVRLIRANCGQDGKRLNIGVASMPVEEQAFTRDQGNHLMGVVHSAFSRLENVQMAPFRDVGAIHELKTVGLTSTPNAGDAERLLQQVQFVVRASGQKFGSSIRFQLTAIGRGDNNCYEATPMINVPQSMAGEIFIPSENIFRSAARELWERSRGVNQVAVASRSVAGASLEPQLPGFFTTKMRQAVSATRASATENIGNPTELDVVASGRATIEPAQRWDAEVVVEPRPNGYKISLDVTRPNTTPIAQYGLVSVDELPALRSRDLARTASIIPKVPVTTSSRTISKAAAPGDAALLAFSMSPTRVQDTLDDETREQRYVFNIARESFVELDVQRLSGNSAVFGVSLLDGDGSTVRPLFEGKARPNLKRFRLPPGKYEARLSTEGRGKHEYLFSSRAVDIGRMLEPEAPGRLTRRFQDWYVGETRRGTNRVCYAYTTAMEVAPVGWREQRPIIWLSMSDNADEPLNHMLDDIQRYESGGPVRATIEGLDGGVKPLQVRALNAHIQPFQMNAGGQAILNRDAIRGYTLGSSIELNGTVAGGGPSRIKYSLIGYRSAVNAAAIACGRRDLANDLVWAGGKF